MLTDVAKTITVAHTFAADILFSDALYDVGKVGATRPRDGFFSRHVTVGGKLLLGTTQVTSASDGEVVLANAKAIREVNAAGTDTYVLIRGDNGNRVFIGDTSMVGIGTPATMSSAAVGDLVLAQGRYIRAANAAGTDTFGLINSANFGGTNATMVGQATVIAFGNPAVISGAAAGDAVLAIGKYLRGANIAGSATYPLIGLNNVGGTNTIEVGDGTFQVNVKWPAVQVPSTDANTLDDYEENSFTPVITFAGASVGMTYGVQQGWYTKVGRNVSFSCFVTLSNKGSSTGVAAVGNLPFVSAASPSPYTAVAVRLDTITFTGRVQAYQDRATTNVNLEQLTEAGAQSQLTHANFANTSTVMVAGTYVV